MLSWNLSLGLLKIPMLSELYFLVQKTYLYIMLNRAILYPKRNYAAIC